MSGFVYIICLFIFNHQDVCISYEHIEPVVALKERPQFRTSPDHGRVFIPQTMVELSEQMGKSANGTKHTYQKAGVDNENGQKAASKLEVPLVIDLGPEIARETTIEEQIKALEEFKKAKQREDNSVPNKDVCAVVVPAQGYWAAQQHLGIGSTVVMSNSNPPMYGTIRWIGTIPQVNGYVAGMELVSVTVYTYNLANVNLFYTSQI